MLGACVLSRRVLPYGVKKDYPKIDLYEKVAGGLAYRGSTTWAHSCKFAIERYAACTGKTIESLRAYFDKRASK